MPLSPKILKSLTLTNVINLILDHLEDVLLIMAFVVFAAGICFLMRQKVM